MTINQAKIFGIFLGKGYPHKQAYAIAMNFRTKKLKPKDKS